MSVKDTKDRMRDLLVLLGAMFGDCTPTRTSTRALARQWDRATTTRGVHLDAVVNTKGGGRQCSDA